MTSTLCKRARYEYGVPDMSFVIHHREKDHIRLVVFLQVSFSLYGRVAAVGRFARLEIKVK